LNLIDILMSMVLQTNSTTTQNPNTAIAISYNQLIQVIIVVGICVAFLVIILGLKTAGLNISEWLKKEHRIEL